MFKTLNLNKIFYLKLVTKILLLLTIIFLVNFIVFFILTSSEPVPKLIEDRLGFSTTTQQEIQQIQQKFNLNRSILERLFIFYGQIFSLNFDQFSTISSKIGVVDNYSLNLFNYFVVESKEGYVLFVIVALVSFCLGYFLGYIAAKNKFKFIDYLINFGVTIFLSISLLVLIPLLIIIDSLFGNVFEFNSTSVRTYVLPFVSLTLITMVSVTQISRKRIIEIFSTNYYQQAKLIGLKQSTIFWKCVFKNSISSVLTLLPFLVVSLFTSSIFLEIYFQFPGNWKNIHSLVIFKEVKAICFLILFLSLIYFFSYTFTEALKTIINPSLNGGK